MSDRLTDRDLNLIGLRFPTHFGMPETSVLVQRLLSELRERRALDLTAEDREALRFARRVVAASEELFADRAVTDARIREHMEHCRAATGALDKLLKEQP